MRVMVFTAALGWTVPLRPPDVLDPAARYVCFTDGAEPPAPYEAIEVPVSAAPSLDSRRIKILQEHPIFAEAEATLWHDASYRLLRPVGWVGQKLKAADLAAMRHPRRGRIEDEMPIIARYGYVTLEEGLALVAGYRAEGFDANVLTSAGLLARRRSLAVGRFNAAWWAEVQRWHGRDQGSIDYAAWKTGVVVQHLKGTVKSNPWAGFR